MAVAARAVAMMEQTLTVPVVAVAVQAVLPLQHSVRARFREETAQPFSCYHQPVHSLIASSISEQAEMEPTVAIAETELLADLAAMAETLLAILMQEVKVATVALAETAVPVVAVPVVQPMAFTPATQLLTVADQRSMQAWAALAEQAEQELQLVCLLHNSKICVDNLLVKDLDFLR